MPTRARDPRRLCRRLAVGAAALALCATLWPPAAQAQSEICHSDDESIAAALAAIRHAVDPCGESAQIGAVLDGLERCSATGYRICTSPDALRNVFDRPLRDIGEFPIGTIVWNPQLRSELESTCDGEPSHAVWRDPAASLLHELVHAAQECAGLNPGEHELEAVRVENIFRRATGLPQRGGYGDTALPPEMVRICSPGSCPCSPPIAPALAPDRDAPSQRAANESADQRSGDRPE